MNRTIWPLALAAATLTLAAAAAADAQAVGGDGNPNHDYLPAWPRYDPERRATMLFDVSCRVEDDPRREERLAWEGMALRH